MILALKKNKLVYLQNLKCGSTFFANNLKHHAGFEKINYHDIDWVKDLVFGHILDPIKRRHKGVAEYIFMLGLADDFLSDPRLRYLLVSTPCLDMHSYPYSWIFKEQFEKIDWIPIQEHNQKTIELTNKLLCSHGIFFDQWFFDYEHKSSIKQKQIEQWLETHWNVNSKQVELMPMDQYKNFVWQNFYSAFRELSWPKNIHFKDFYLLPQKIKSEIKINLPDNIVCDNNSIDIVVDKLPTISINSPPEIAFDQDIKLYKKILENFNFDGKTWQDISWLKNKK
jgi:hypothetical protein